MLDLADMKRRADERDAAAEALAVTQAKQKSEEDFKAFDSAMQRAFKGIVSRPERHRLMLRALQRSDK